MAQRAGHHGGLVTVRYDFGHRRVIAGEPVGWPKTIADLRSRELERASRNMLQTRVGSRLRIARPHSGRIGSIRPSRRPIGGYRRTHPEYQNQNRARKAPEGSLAPATK
jgi:hypothetical protein